MATFSELTSDVMVITNRPDLVAETKLAVKQATLKMHQSDHYPKDLFESGITFQSPSNIQSVDYRTLVPRWRTFKYLRKYSNGYPGEFFTLLTPEETLDRYQINRENICYVAGEQLEIRSNTADSHALLACYLHPDITENNFTSWIAVEHPYAIVYEAAAKVFKMLGQDEQHQAMRQEVAEQYMLLKQQVTA
jgi:hypothetical protein